MANEQVHEQWCPRFMRDDGTSDFKRRRFLFVEALRRQGRGAYCTCTQRTDTRRDVDKGDTGTRRGNTGDRRIGAAEGIGCRRVLKKRRQARERRGL